MKVIVLGSAQDGGLPQIGGKSVYDKQAVSDPKLQKLAASLCVLSDNGDCLLIDASPDIRLQHLMLRQFPEYESPRENTSKPLFNAIILTHAHIGHYAGLIHLGKEAANTTELPLYGTKSMLNFLSSNAPWAQLLINKNLSFQILNEADSLKSFEPFEGLTVQPFFVPHRAEFTDTIGVSLNNKVIYIPDIDSWEHWEEEAMKWFLSHEVCLIDGTFYDPQTELTGLRSFHQIPHPPVVDSLQRFQRIVGSKEGRFPRIVFTHLNHTNPLCSPSSPEFSHVISCGFEVAQDGSIFDL